MILSFLSLLIAIAPAEKQAQVIARGQTFAVEVVRTPETWQRGLMFREHLGKREGMLFWGTQVKPMSFWMKNTLVSLDIIFISKDLKVINIHEKTTPLSEESLPSAAPALHVLEILGGQSSKIGLKTGDQLVFKNF